MWLLKSIPALLSVKLGRKQWVLLIWWPDQLTSPAYKRWQTRELAPKTAVSTVDYHFLGFKSQEWFALVGECSFSIFIDQLSLTTSPTLLLPISMRRATLYSYQSAPHTLYALSFARRTETHRSWNHGLSSVLTKIVRLGTQSFLITRNSASFSDDTGHWGLMIHSSVETLPISSNQLPVRRVLKIDLHTRQVKNRLLQNNIYKNSTMIWGSNWQTSPCAFIVWLVLKACVHLLYF